MNDISLKKGSGQPSLNSIIYISDKFLAKLCCARHLYAQI